jgi:hypothetical protein
MLQPREMATVPYRKMGRIVEFKSPEVKPARCISKVVTSSRIKMTENMPKQEQPN